MRNKITLKKIAQELNVSISTVSKSLKDSHEIGKETRERIKAFAKSHGYRPNSIALSLKNRKTKTIGVIIPDVVHYFFALVVNGIEQVARKNGYNVVVALSNESFEKEVVNMETLADRLKIPPGEPGHLPPHLAMVELERQSTARYEQLARELEEACGS